MFFPQFFLKPNYFGKNLVGEFLRLRERSITIWTDFTRRPRKLINESYICVLKGEEQLRMVSPIFRKNIYVGVFEGKNLRPDQTPLNFFDIDKEKYPYTTQVSFLDVTLRPGDCVYVPAFYYVQSKTTYERDNQESIIVHQTYAPHSVLVDYMMSALDEEKLTDDRKHEYDVKL